MKNLSEVALSSCQFDHLSQASPLNSCPHTSQVSQGNNQPTFSSWHDSVSAQDQGEESDLVLGKHPRALWPIAGI